jgi:hypothetical protein
VIWLPFKADDEVTLRCALHSRGIDPQSIRGDDAQDVALAAVLEILTEEIRRNQPKPLTVKGPTDGTVSQSVA